MKFLAYNRKSLHIHVQLFFAKNQKSNIYFINFHVSFVWFIYEASQTYNSNLFVHTSYIYCHRPRLQVEPTFCHSFICPCSLNNHWMMNMMRRNDTASDTFHKMVMMAGGCCIKEIHVHVLITEYYIKIRVALILPCLLHWTTCFESL